MDHLNKQQLILLALLVSFVTALATGIVTVSLMGQAPQGVTQTISKVVERTIQVAASTNQTGNTADAANSIDTQVSDAVDKVSASLVHIRSRNSLETSGLGIILNDKGVIVTDKTVVTASPDPVAVLSNGTVVPLSIFLTQTQGDVIFLQPTNSIAPNPDGSNAVVFSPANIAEVPRLGQMVWTLTGTTTLILGQGLTSEINDIGTSSIITSIPGTKTVSGSPLFDLKGEILGMHTSSLGSEQGAEFIPIAPLQSVIPVVR